MWPYMPRRRAASMDEVFASKAIGAIHLFIQCRQKTCKPRYCVFFKRILNLHFLCSLSVATAASFSRWKYANLMQRHSCLYSHVTDFRYIFKLWIYCSYIPRNEITVKCNTLTDRPYPLFFSFRISCENNLKIAKTLLFDIQKNNLNFEMRK